MIRRPIRLKNTYDIKKDNLRKKSPSDLQKILPSDLLKYVIIPYLDECDLKIILEFHSVDQIREAEDLCINIHAYEEYALRWASENGYLEVVKVLLEKEANVHANNDDAILVASYMGHIEIVKILLANGANIDAIDEDGDSVLILACENGNLNIVELLFTKGVDIHANNDEPFMLASRRGQLEVVKFLLANGANIHSEEDDAIIYASMNGYLEVVKFLLANGADVEAERFYGIDKDDFHCYDFEDTAYDLALKNGRDDVVEVLKLHIVQINMHKEKHMELLRDGDGDGIENQDHELIISRQN
jgi:hypothetical protein